MRVEIKNNDVMESIYALSALQGYVELPERERALLQEDQREGLMVLVGDAFAEIVLALMPRVKEFGLPEENEQGDMWIEIDSYGEKGVAQVAVSAMLTKSVACMVLEAIYGDSYEGVAYGRRAKRGLELVKDAIDYRDGEFPRLLGWR